MAGFVSLKLSASMLGMALTLGGCVHQSSKSHESAANVNQSKENATDPWFQGSVEEAFTASKTSGKPVFLYWGAVWCPPCNELKSQVFSHPEFPELMQSLIPVYLDGDEPSAQIWGDRLQAAGYPTILMLNAERKEYLRINGALSFAEFKEIVQSALNQPEDVLALLQRVDRAELRSSDWTRLAFLDWEQLPAERITLERQWQSLDRLVQIRPKDLPPAVQGSLIAQYIIMSQRLQDEERVKKDIAQRLPNLRKLLLEISEDPEKTYGARQMLIFRYGVIVPWLEGNPERPVVSEAWQHALTRLSEDERLSVDQRLWLSYPPVEAYRWQHPEKELPGDLVEQVRVAAKEADTAAQSKYDRHAVISGAAYLLRQVKLDDAARELLHKEIRSTDTPWYYYSSLANLEEAFGDRPAALRYSQLARETAKGRATRIQWITNDLLLNLRFQERAERIRPLVQEFYDLAFQLDDGFLGRNQSRTARIADGLKPLASSMKPVLEKFQQRCQNLEGDNRSSCEAHFKALI
ncbi:MAG: thioredoxin family protein [Oligoflexus sp.]